MDLKRHPVKRTKPRRPIALGRRFGLRGGAGDTTHALEVDNLISEEGDDLTSEDGDLLVSE